MRAARAPFYLGVAAPPRRAGIHTDQNTPQPDGRGLHGHAIVTQMRTTGPQRTRVSDASNGSDRPRMPALLLFDFASAFPSIAHPLLADKIRVFKSWQPCAPGVGCLRHDNNDTDIGFRAVSGIPHSCPLSGSVYACACLSLIGSFKTAPAMWMHADDLTVVSQDVAELGGVTRFFAIFGKQ